MFSIHRLFVQNNLPFFIWNLFDLGSFSHFTEVFNWYFLFLRKRSRPKCCCDWAFFKVHGPIAYFCLHHRCNLHFRILIAVLVGTRHCLSKCWFFETQVLFHYANRNVNVAHRLCLLVFKWKMRLPRGGGVSFSEAGPCWTFLAVSHQVGTEHPLSTLLACDWCGSSVFFQCWRRQVGSNENKDGLVFLGCTIPVVEDWLLNFLSRQLPLLLMEKLGKPAEADLRPSLGLWP